MTNCRRTRQTLCVALLLAAAAAVAFQGTPVEVAARRRFEAGLNFMATGRHEEGLKDFREIVETYPASSVADDAWLQIALHALEVARDPDGAQAAAETVIRTYGDRDAAPMAHVVVGRAALARGRSPEQIEAALASFERVATLYPGDTDALPAAIHGAAETLRLAGRVDEAIEHFERLTADHPRSPWTAHAAFGLARCLTRAGDTARALTELQRVRLRFPGSDDSERALGGNTILFRLYVLAPGGRPPFQLVPGTQPAAPGSQRIVAAAISPDTRLHLVSNDSVAVFDAAGAAAGVIRTSNARGMIFGPSGQKVVVRQDGLQPGQAPPMPLVAARPGRPARALNDILAAAVSPAGDLFVADGDLQSIERFAGAAWQLDASSPQSQAPGAAGSARPAAPVAVTPSFARVDAVRLAVNSLDEVAALEARSRSVIVLDRGGQPAGRIPPRGPGYELRNPVDIAYDTLDHLYVLDRDSGSVFVFGQALGLVSTFTLPATAPGEFRRARAFAIDATGGLYIVDDRQRRILVYR